MNFKSNIVKIYRLFQRHNPKYVRKYSSIVQTVDHQNFVPLHELSDRREKLLGKFEQCIPKYNGKQSNHIVVIPAAEVQYMSYHVPYPFHQDSSFYYFTGLKEPNGILVLSISFDHSDHGTSNHMSGFSYDLFVEVRSPKVIQWDGPTLGPTSAGMLTGIRSVHPRSDFKKFLEHQFSSSSVNYPTHLWYTGLTNSNPSQRPISRSVLAEVLKFQNHFQTNPIAIHSPDYLIDQLRVRKSPLEIKLLRRAAEITARALKSTMGIAYPGISEADLHNRFEFEVRSHGASLGYPPVIGGGQRANIIHYLDNNDHVKDGELVLMDVGARFGGYTADMTRTWPVNGVFTSVQRILYEILIEVQEACVRNASPQHTLNDLYQLMLREMNRHLVNEKIIPEESSTEIIRRICPHHVGHYLGLDVHDAPTVPNSQKLEPGFVFPIEPGFYFRPELESVGVRKEFLTTGLRLEDDYAMLENGTVSCLTSTMPTKVSDIESLIGCSNGKITNDLEALQTY